MEAISWPSALAYCLLSIFLFYQQRHIQQFKGSSAPVLMWLNLSVLAGRLTGLGYLIYYGWTVAWWAPVLIFVIGMLSTVVGVAIERITGELAISMAGFVGWPICAYLMFTFVPIVV
jgi:hypothetical protein